MTPSGIEAATFRFVAQHLNHCSTAVPKFVVAKVKKVINNRSNSEFLAENLKSKILCQFAIFSTLKKTVVTFLTFRGGG